MRIFSSKQLFLKVLETQLFLLFVIISGALLLPLKAEAITIKVRGNIKVRAISGSNGVSTTVAHIKSDGGYCNTSPTGNVQGFCTTNVQTNTFTYTPNTTGNGVLFTLACAANQTPTSVTLTASGWNITKVIDIFGTTADGYTALFRAYAPSTALATFTMSWTAPANGCVGFMADLVDEFSGTEPTNFIDNTNTFHVTGAACSQTITPVVANTMLYGACVDDVTAAGGGGFALGASDGLGDSTEYKLLSGGAGSAQTVDFGHGAGNSTELLATVKGSAGGRISTIKFR